MMLVTSCIPFPFSAPCDDMLAMLVCPTRWLYMHLYTLTYLSMHESCLLMCRPCFNTIKLCTFDPNLHLSLADTTFCSFSCLFAFSLVCLLFCLPCLSCLFALCLFICFLHLFLPWLVCWFLVSAFASTHMEWGHMELGYGFPSTSKMDADASMWLSQAAIVSRFRSLASPLWFMYSVKPLPSSPLSPLDGLYLVYHAMYHSSSSLDYSDPCLLSYSYILGHALGM